MRYYYTDAANQPAGPCDLDQLKALAAEGKITDLTSVIPEGGQIWVTYGSLKSGAIPPPPPTPKSSVNLSGVATIMGDTVGSILGRISGWLSARLLQNSLSFAGKYGHFAVLAGALLGLILSIILAVRYHSAYVFFTGGIGFVLAVAVAQFSAQRFMTAGTTLIASSPNRLSSKSFLECVGLFAVLGAIGALVGGIVSSIQLNSLLPLVPALLLFAYLLYFAMTALHPEELNVTVGGDTTAGQEAISLLSFFCKVGLKLAPLYFFLLAVAGAIFILLALFDNGQGGGAPGQLFLSIVPLPPMLAGVAQNSPGQMLVLVACLVPVVIYFFFLLYYLLLDLMRAVLAVPGKLDELKKS
ncbi:MAG: GYF domain-containing protein [Opitutaceae bacterium]